MLMYLHLYIIISNLYVIKIMYLRLNFLLYLMIQDLETYPKIINLQNYYYLCLKLINSNITYQ